MALLFNLFIFPGQNILGVNYLIYSPKEHLAHWFPYWHFGPSSFGLGKLLGASPCPQLTLPEVPLSRPASPY